MAGRGLRSILQPVLFIGIASLLHGVLFLIPGGEPARRDAGTSRGLRVKTYVEGPRTASPAPVSRSAPPNPTAPAVRDYSMPGRDAKADAGNRGGGKSGSGGGPSGEAGPSAGPVVGSGGPGAPSAWDLAMQKIGSAETRGWAEKSAKASRQGWKGSGAGSGGWGAGSGTGSDSGAATGSGKGTGPGGRGSRGGGYLDPRVRMVIIQYPSGERGQGEVDKGRNIENRFRPVPYPDVKVKQSRFTSGWWNVYIELWTTKEGRIARYDVLRPETQGPQERVFIDQVTREMERWTFDPGPSEIHVDVRFYVE